jgi:hypothetical protein
VLFFVLARYGAHFDGPGEREGAAVWSDWAHFRMVHRAAPHASLHSLSARLAAEIDVAYAEIRPQSIALPLPGLAVILNPSVAASDGTEKGE